jgi:hypothetical protein
LGEEQVDTEGSILILQVALQLGDLLTEHIRSITDTTDNTQTTGIGDSSRQLRAGGHVHTSQQNGVVDLEQIGDGSADDLCGDDIVSTCLEDERTKKNGKTVETLTRGSHDAMRCDAELERWRKRKIWGKAKALNKGRRFLGLSQTLLKCLGPFQLARPATCWS